MAAINRQQFLTELSKLLTFMYEEDRQRALSMYERMFDIAEDEQGLIQHLMSPTRQAVIIARAYDDKERKLSVSSQARGDSGEAESGAVPKFVLAVNKVFDDLFPDSAEETLSQDQVTFFDLGVAAKDDFTAAKPSVPAGAVLLSDTQQFRLEDVDVTAGTDEVPGDLPLPEAADAEEAPESVSAETEFDPETTTVDELISSLKRDLEAEAASYEAAADETASAKPSDAELSQPSSEASLQSADAEDAAAADQTPVSGDSAPALEDASFPADETDPDLLSGEENASEELSAPLPEEEPAADGPDFQTAPADAAEEAELPEESVSQVVPAPAASLRGKPSQALSVPKLILFLIPAIPLTLALLALLLIPALLFLGVSLGLIALGASLVVSAFSGFSVLADLLLLIGAALAVLALGLLFLWLFVWVIGSGMGGLVRSVLRLGRQFCIKEVPAA